MTCQLHQVLKIHDLEQLAHHLCPKVQLKSELNRDEDYDNRWNWDEDACKVSISNHSKILQSCSMAVSPDLTMITFGYENNLVVYRINPSNGSSDSGASFVCSKSLPGLSPREMITCIAFLPIASTRTTDPNCIDWCAIIVGFSSGFVRIYTENASLLLVQRFEEYPVRSIKCSSSTPKSNVNKYQSVQNESFDGVTIYIANSVIQIEGFALYQTLRSARNQLARLRLDEDFDLGLTLAFKKLILEKSNLTSVNDVATVGYSSDSVFDQMVRNTVTGRFHPPKKETSHLKVVTTGEEPFFSVLVSSGSEFNPSINDVAQVVVSQVKKFIPLFGQKPSNQSTEIPPSNLRLRCALYDQHREGSRIVLSPDKKYAAVSDEYGRVILIDTSTTCTIKMWKGYRDAECAWVEVSETPEVGSKKSSCLVIYAPKRGLVEIWRAERGPRIASFVVGKECRLLSNDNSLLGSSLESKPATFHSCCIFDCDKATVMRIEVPFVCTLTDENNQIVKSSHLLKEFKKLIDHKSNNSALRVLLQIEGRSFQVEAIEYLVKKLDQDSLEKMLINVIQGMKASEVNRDAISGYDCKLVLQMISRILNLLKVYRTLLENGKECPTTDDVSELPDDIDSFATGMGWKASDVAKCISLFNLRSSIITTSDPEVSVTVPLSDFVSSFDIFQTQVAKNSDGDVLDADVPVGMKWKDLDQTDLRIKVSNFLFEPYFRGHMEEEEFFSIIEESKISPNCLLKLVITSWLSSENHANHWLNWLRLTKAVKKIAENLDETSEDNSLTASWRSVCGLIASCSKQASALTAAFAINAVLAEKGFSKSLTDDPKSLDTQDEEWETVYIDQEKLNIFLKQLEDLFILDILLKTSKTFSNPITLISVLKSDSGIVSELVAKWAVSSNIKPQVMTNFCNETQVAEEDETASEAILLDSLDIQSLSELFSHVGRRFPASLEHDTIAANCSWESLNSWLKSPSNSNSAFLQRSSEYLSSITSATLKHNLSSFIWTKQLVRISESLCVLLEKMAKTPKDRICRKELGFPEDCLTSFVNYAHDILDSILSNSGASEHEQLLVAVDDYWKSSAKRETALIQLVSNVSKCNHILVIEHLHLITIIKFIVTFHLKGIKPLSFFLPSTRQFLFKDIHMKGQFQSDVTDYQLIDVRTKLMNCFTYAIAENITISSGLDSSLGSDRSKTLLCANKWFGEVLVLSREWHLDLESIRRRFVSDLYLNSVDDLAEEVLCTIGDRSGVTSDLMVVAGHRMLSLLSTCPPGTEESVSVTLLEWLRSIQEEVVRTVKTSKESTGKLLQTILNDIVDVDSLNYKLVKEMINSLDLIVE